MSTQTARRATPASRDELVAELRAAGESSAAVRLSGGATKLSWGIATGSEPEVVISTAGLDRVVEHNAGDLTAVIEAGAPLERAQATFAGEDQMLALDPPDGGATLGGILAAGDSGPLRSRYGGVRDLVVGATVALSDGTVAKAGGKVIKNVAGYDLAKLFCGSLGSLGAILEVAVRLHPIPPSTVTAVGRSADAAEVAEAAAALAHASLEHMGLDVAWRAGEGRVLARFGGTTSGPQAEAAAAVLREHALAVELADRDDALWAEQRDAQRARPGSEDLVLRVSALPTELPRLMAVATDHSATLVGRAGLGLSWVRVADPGAAEGALAGLRGVARTAVLDVPPSLRGRLDPWGRRDAAALVLARRVKEGFDRAGVCSPGVVV